jgi:outer membrane protein insertion porin family
LLVLAPSWVAAQADPSSAPQPAQGPEPVRSQPAASGAEPLSQPEDGEVEPSLTLPASGPSVGPLEEPGISSPPGAPVRYTLEGVEVRGNTRTGSRVVLRYVPFEVGDVIDVDDPELELARYRLLTTGFFRDVQFSLRKGSSRGLVVLVIEVVERNTIVLQSFSMGLSADADTQGDPRPLTAYAGAEVAETNLAGTGIALGFALALAQDQVGLRVRFLDPALLGSHWLASVSLLYNGAQDFFGNSGVVYTSAVPGPVRDFAVVKYKRSGGWVGVGRDLSIATQVWFHYRLESIDAIVPAAASHERGGEVEPIAFDANPGQSVLSTARVSLQYDSRDQPFLPTRGWFATVNGELALAPFGSDYDYQRVEVQASHWWRLPWQHVARLELFAGSITGYAPFFEQYYVGDFSDFLAHRLLGLNFDRRPPPNFLGTAVAEVRRGHYAMKLGGEYRMPLYRGQRSVYGIDLFASAGLWALAGQRDIDHPVSTYRGVARIPVDLTANLGLRMDTSAGGMTFAFSNVLGFVPLRPEDH